MSRSGARRESVLQEAEGVAGRRGLPGNCFKPIETLTRSVTSKQECFHWRNSTEHGRKTRKGWWQRSRNADCRTSVQGSPDHPKSWQNSDEAEDYPNVLLQMEAKDYFLSLFIYHSVLFELDTWTRHNHRFQVRCWNVSNFSAFRHFAFHDDNNLKCLLFPTESTLTRLSFRAAFAGTPVY